MKKAFYRILVLFIYFGCGLCGVAQNSGLRPDSLSKDMATLLKAVRLQKQGMAEKDRYALTDAIDLYSSLSLLYDKDNKTLLISKTDDLQKTRLSFSKKFCEKVIENSFTPFYLTDIKDEVRRPAPPYVIVTENRLKNNGSVTFSLRARRACQVFIVGETGAHVEVAIAGVMPDGNKIEIEDADIKIEDDDSTSIILWYQPKGCNFVEITVKNTGEEPTDFILAAA